MAIMESPPKILIIRMRFVPVIDATGIHSLERVLKDVRHNHTQFILSGVQPEVAAELEKYGVLDLIGRDNVHDLLDNALTRAEVILGSR